MNPVDAVLLLVVLLSAWGGWRRGFAQDAPDLVALLASLAIALAAYPWPAAWLQARQAFGIWAAPIAFIAVFLVTRVLMAALAKRATAGVSERALAHPANRVLGLLPGAVRGLVNASVLALVMLVLPMHDAVTRLARDSRWATPLAAPAEWAEARLAPIFDAPARSTLGRIIVEPQTADRIELPFRLADAPPRPELEERMIALVNAERAKQGLRALAYDPVLLPVARAHSDDMFGRGYFSHVDPDGQDPFDRLRRARVNFSAAGENLALARTLEQAHEGLMNSPGHRANILRPQFGRIGIGVLDGGRRGLMVTQVFRN